MYIYTYFFTLRPVTPKKKEGEIFSYLSTLDDCHLDDPAPNKNEIKRGCACRYLVRGDTY